MRVLARAILVLSAVAVGACASVHDLAIVGGRVIDGTGRAPRAATVLVDGDAIRAIVPPGRRIRARETIDARGAYVTPGFIDLHAHGNPLVDRSFANFLLQGATTVVLGQDGMSPQDTGSAYAAAVSLDVWERSAAASTPSDASVPVTLAQWMRRVEQGPMDVNVAPLSGHGTLRTVAGTGVSPTPTEAQKRAMERILRADLDAGAFGLSSGLEYVPGVYASTGELVALADVVGERDGVVMSHLRSEDDDKIARAIDELVAQGRRARVEVSHLKIVYGREARQARAVLDALGAARERGVRVQADVYPYLAGYADMTLLYPDWARRREQWDVAVRERRGDLEQYLFERVMRRNGPGAILITSGTWAGKTLDEVATETRKPFVEVLIDTFGYGGPLAAHRVMSADVQDVFVLSPDVAISTDGGPWIRHPRSWGTYSRVLEEYVQRRGALSVEAAVRKMTALPASVLGLTDRGRIAPGLKADLVVFDLAAVRTRATWTDPALPPSGFTAVVLNGQVAARDGVQSSARAGRMLRAARGGREP